MTRSNSPILLLLLAGILIVGCAGDDAAEPMASSDTAGESPTGPDATVPDGENMEVPATWKYRPDRTDRAYSVGADSTADVFFVNMTPGWHVTTGPAGIFYHPGGTASGEYSATTEIHLFDPEDRREAFGLFIGGQDLEGEDQSYTYFLIRQGGEFLIKERTGADTRVLTDWTANAAVKSHQGGPSDTALNNLSVRVQANTVEFLVNGTTVATMPRDDVQTDGVVGLRVNHGLNLHISGFEIEPAAM